MTATMTQEAYAEHSFLPDDGSLTDNGCHPDDLSRPDDRRGLDESRETSGRSEPSGEREGPPAGQSRRHPTLAVLCEDLHHMITGRVAQDLLADHLPGGRTGIFVAPSWAWLHPRIRVGRKARDLRGGTLLLPVRLTFDPAPIHLIPAGGSETARWVLGGMGHYGTGTVLLSCGQRPSGTLPTGIHGRCPDLGTAGDPSTGAGPAAAGSLDEIQMLTSRGAVKTELERLVERAARSRWNLLQYLEPHATRSLHSAHASVSREIAGDSTHAVPLLDETKLQTLKDHMVLGDDDHPGTVAPLLDRCLKPETFLKVDPLRYLAVSMRRDAEAVIRKAIGDPHIGRKVRAVARETGLRDLDTIIAAYRERHPSDFLSVDRAEAALSVGSDAMAAWGRIDPSGPPGTRLNAAIHGGR